MLDADILGTSMLSVHHKVVFVGNPSTGKTSIMKRFISNEFSDDYDPTIGVDFYTKEVKYQDTVFKLQLWDTAGQEKYKSLIPAYIKGSSIIFLLYDITEEDSFKSINNWLKFIKDNIEIGVSKVILLANKIDLKEERKIKKEKGINYSKKENLPFYEVSAKTGEGINEAFYGSLTYIDFFDNIEKTDKLIRDLIEQNTENYKGKIESSEDPSKIGLQVIGKGEKQEKKKKCIC